MPTATAERTSVLTPKQERFAEEYVANGGNASKAAEAAGYSPSVCHAATREVLGSNAVQKSISEHLAELRERTYQKLAALAGQALDILAGIAADPLAPATARVSAANSILDRASFARGADAPVIDGSAERLDDILASI